MSYSVCHIVICAGGSGRRFGASCPKQYCIMDGRPVLMHTIDAMRDALPDAVLHLVINRDMEPLWTDLCDEYGFESPRIVYGGDTRWASVRNAVLSLPEDDDAIVLVHDGVRPLARPEVVRGVVAALSDGHAGAVPVVAVNDSLRRIGEGGRSQAVDRSEYVAVQTPQGFGLPLLRDAYRRPYLPVMTDDASVVEAYGCDDIALTAGSPDNIKITAPHDIVLASELMKQGQITR